VSAAVFRTCQFVCKVRFSMILYWARISARRTSSVNAVLQLLPVSQEKSVVVPGCSSRNPGYAGEREN
jgi:hypothetical protein